MSIHFFIFIVFCHYPQKLTAHLIFYETGFLTARRFLLSFGVKSWYTIHIPVFYIGVVRKADPKYSNIFFIRKAIRWQYLQFNVKRWNVKFIHQKSIRILICFQIKQVVDFSSPISREYFFHVCYINIWKTLFFLLCIFP